MRTSRGNTNVTLHNGDCLFVLPSIKEKVKLVIIDPPFNLGKSYEEKLTEEEYLHRCWTWVRAIGDVVDDDAAIFFMTYQEMVGNMMGFLSGAGWKFRNLIVWYNSSMPVKNRFCIGYQPILYYVRDLKHYTFNFGEQKRKSDAALPWGRENKAGSIKDIWDDIPFVSGGCMASKEAILEEDSKKKAHPAQMPMALAERMILYASKPGDLVLDPMMGSGTVPFVAKRLGRECIGIEKDTVYFELSEKRITNDSN